MIESRQEALPNILDHFQRSNLVAAEVPKVASLRFGSLGLK
ncbi:MAG: hypothetical protein ACI8UO_002244 [Verrucomicrobiales bacterium]|jgi:hypothetical protein